jgi:hypothetical protein
MKRSIACSRPRCAPYRTTYRLHQPLDRGPALPVRLQPRPGATRLIVGQPPGRTFPVSRNRALVVAFTIAASLMIVPAVAGTPIYLSADPPKAKIDSGPSLSLGRVGPDLCPGGLCRTELYSNLYNFITPKGPRPNRAGARNSAEHPARQCCALNPIRTCAGGVSICPPNPICPEPRRSPVISMAHGLPFSATV